MKHTDPNSNLVSTKDIQMQSLLAFADELGYEYYGSWHGFDGKDKFIRRDFEGFPTCKFISINKFVWLHNTSWIHSHTSAMRFPYPGGFHTCVSGQSLKLKCEIPFEIDLYIYNKAQAAKIVSEVYLNGGHKGISCYRDLVCFVCEEYYDQFLLPIIKESENV